MPLHLMVIVFCTLLVLALIARPLSERLNLPFAATLVIIGAAGSYLMEILGFSFRPEPGVFKDLIFYVLLPVLVFEAAYRIDAENLFRQIAPILFFAIPLFLLSTLIIALLLYFGSGQYYELPFMGALLAGALLSSTDPVSIMSRLELLGVPKRLRLIMEGEGIFNDATAIVTFSIILYLIMHPQEVVTTGDTVTMFIAVYFGGGIVGLLAGVGFMLLTRLCRDPVPLAMCTLISAYGAYFFAEDVLHVSGVMAVLITALVMGRVVRFEYPGEGSTFIDRLWALNAHIADSLVFLLTGVTLTLEMFQLHWMAVLAALLSILVARAMGVFGFVPIFAMLPGVERIPLNCQATLVWGGVRGAVTLALALSIPPNLPYAQLIQSAAFGAVLFSLFIQAPSIGSLTRRLGVQSP